MAIGLFPKAENFASEIVVHGCARPWFVYVETFIPAFLKLFLTLAILDLEDLLRAHAKAKVGEKLGGLRGGLTHGSRGPYANANRKVTRFSQQALKTLLIITEPLEKIGFAWLLYNSTEQFFYDWQLLLQRSQFCSDAGLAGPFQRSRPGGTNIGILPEGSATPLPTIEQNRANWPNEGFRVDLPPGFYTCIWALEVEGPLGGITGVQARLRLSGITLTPFFDGDTSDFAEGQAGSVMVKGDFTLPFGGSIGWELRGPAVPVGLLCNGAHVIVFARE